MWRPEAVFRLAAGAWRRAGSTSGFDGRALAAGDHGLYEVFPVTIARKQRAEDVQHDETNGEVRKEFV